MQRRTAEPGLVDAMTADLGGPRSRQFFAACQQHIPWQQLAESVADIFPPTASGRPHWPIVQMIKCLFLAKWFNLSDPQLEEVLQDRLSFRRFVGLSLQDATPDETTICLFRRRLREAGHATTLFDKALQHLRARGLVLEAGTLVDARIVQAPLGGPRADGSSSRDPEATYTAKGGRAYHGYKTHIASDRRGIITDYRFDTAKVADCTHADGLMAREKLAVFADSAYMDRRRSEGLRRRGVFCGILQRRVRGQAALTDLQKARNRACASIRAAVEHPFAWMAKMGYQRVRYRGLERNAFDFAMLAVAYNFKRAFSLLARAT